MAFPEVLIARIRQKPAFTFTNAVLNEIGLSTSFRLGTKIQEKLEDREIQRKQLSSAKSEYLLDWETLINKIVRFRPRLIGAIGAYSLLSGLNHKEIMENQGMDIFRLLWFLASAQDDLIDATPRAEIEDLTTSERIKHVKKTVFGVEKEFYRAVFDALIDQIDGKGLEKEASMYLKKSIAQWYRFLFMQEADALSMPLERLTFEYCKNYREGQNRQIGRTLVACLNGKMCLDPELRVLEEDVPLLSYRTQIVDDIADIREDLDGLRPSYAIGALVDHLAELDKVRDFIKLNPRVGKLTPNLLRSLAPESFHMIKDAYDKYARELKKYGATGEFLVNLGTPLFYLFPIYRDLMYKINPRFSNF